MLKDPISLLSTFRKVMRQNFGPGLCKFIGHNTNSFCLEDKVAYALVSLKTSVSKKGHKLLVVGNENHFIYCEM